MRVCNSANRAAGIIAWIKARGQHYHGKRRWYNPFNSGRQRFGDAVVTRTDVTRKQQGSSHDVINGSGVGGTTWECSGIAVQLNVNCSYHS